MRRASIQVRLLTSGILLTALPVCAVIALSLFESRRAASIAFEGSVGLADSDLNHVSGMIQGVADSDDQLLREEVSTMLRVAGSLSRRMGPPHASGAPDVWMARNQLTQAESRIVLPRFAYGAMTLSRDPEPNTRAIFVDDVRDLTLATCTVFQRMNAAGDMLRISTNVIAKNGKRGVGTYIPVENPDGKRNPVLARVLNGETYTGRAFVVDSWYMSAYEPIRLNAGSRQPGAIIGMLYVGVPEKVATAALWEMMSKMHFGPSGRVLVFNATGANRGRALWPGTEEIVSRLNGAKSEGRSAAETVLLRAVALAPGSSELLHYQAADGRKRMIRFAYYRPWDWVIGIDTQEDEVLAAALRIEAANRSARSLMLLVGLAALLAASITWWFHAGGLSGQLQRVVRQIRSAAQEVRVSTANVVEQSGLLEQSAEAQNEAIARSEELGVRLNRQSAEMRQAVERASEVMNAVRSGTSKSNGRLEEMIESMRAIAGSSNKIAGIIHMIDEIALQTRMLALNASIEAARAGKAGESFAVVAGQVGRTAQRCSEAAAETSELIEECMSVSASGGVRLDGLVADIREMEGDLGAVDKIVVSIAEMSRAQSGDLSETAESLCRIGQATGLVRDTAVRNANSGRTLSDQRNALDAVIAQLEAVCNGNRK